MPPGSGELGYKQELDRRLRIFDTAALGFAGISPVVGLYAVVLVGTLVAGPAWVWVLPVALAGQCLLLAVYSELASEFPIAGGAYQWSRRLIGGSYGWFAGWVAICAYAAANTTVAYLGAPWALTLLDIEPTPHAVVITGMALVVICALAGALGVGVLSRAVKAGIAAEVVASVGIGLALLLVFAEQDLSIFTETFGAEALSGGSVAAGLLAALAVGGWVFIGFDCAVGVAEETQARRAARAEGDLDRAAERRRARDPQCGRGRAGAPRPGVDRGRRGPRSGDDRGGQLIRLVVVEAVRGDRAGRVPGLRHGGPVRHRPHDVLGRARRRGARGALPAPGRPRARSRSARSW